MLGDLNKAGQMAQQRLAAVPPEQVKRIADNIEVITANFRDVSSMVREVVLLVNAKLLKKE